MSEQLERDPLGNAGMETTEYTLIDDRGYYQGDGPHDTLRDARAARDDMDTERTIHIVREDRTVVPDGADAYLWGVVDHALAYELLASARAVMEGDADELDHRRPHPPAYAFLYDISETLRHRARYTDTALETGLTPPHADERLEQAWNHIPEERRGEGDE